MKIFSDTLKSPNNKWSRKSLTLFASFAISIVLGLYIVASDYILEEEINKYAIEVFNGFMLLVAALTGATVADKFTPSKKDQTDEP